MNTNGKRSVRMNESHLSPDTRNLIKGLIKQSRLNETQRRIMDQLINNGTTLPANPGLNSAPIRALDAACVNNSSSKRIPLKRRPRIRMLDSMIESGAFEIEPYRPIATKDRTLEKEKLQNLMAGEEELKQQKSKNIEFIDDEEELDERKMLIQEIKERRAWLDEMTALNKGDKFKHQIESEIAIRLNQIQLLSSEK